MNSNITFSFGKNWKNYAETINDTAIRIAREDIEDWLGIEGIDDKIVLDIGSGSGIHSLVFHQKGAKSLISFDYDIYSVETTKLLWEKAGKPGNWQITQGSILDKTFLEQLGKFNIVYAWGVLHHTGSMWEAIENTLALVENNGFLFVSLYTKGPNYEKHLALKQQYNKAFPLGKKVLEWKYILGMMKWRLKRRKNPFAWNETKERGMNVYYDIVDWLGGLPYEVASPTELIEFCQKFGFILIKIKELSEGGCSQYLFQKKS